MVFQCLNKNLGWGDSQVGKQPALQAHRCGLDLSNHMKSWIWWHITYNPSTAEVNTLSLLVSQPCLPAELQVR